MIKTEITGGPLSGDYSHSGSLVNSRLLGPSRPPTSTPGAISPSHLNGNREGISNGNTAIEPNYFCNIYCNQYSQSLLLICLGLPPQHSVLPPSAAYYGTGQPTDHQTIAHSGHHSPNKYGHPHSVGVGSHHLGENGHDGSFADFVTLVSQQEHGQNAHVAAVSAAATSLGGSGQGVIGHPGPVRSPYSASGYPPAPVPPSSISHVSRPLAVHRSNGKNFCNFKQT